MTPIVPDWPAPARVRALATTRGGGVSEAGWASLNLGDSCGDAPAAVAENRRRLRQALPSDPCWLKQVHGDRVIHLDRWQPGIQADAAWTDRPHQVCAILTADCLPILLAEAQGALVAAVHAGWRGLAADILGAVIATLPAAPENLLAWIGPSIRARHYEVDAPVRDALLALQPDLSGAFEPSREGHWLADLQAVADRRLRTLGVAAVFDAKLCTADDPQRFFSYRRDRGLGGRQASLIWLA
jgi:YfiH family protein